MRTISLVICMAFLSSAIYAPVVKACMICILYPKTTFADVLNEREPIVFAREKIGKAYYFYAVEVLKGVIDGDEFKAYIYSTDRRMLSKNLKDVAVFAKKDSGDDWQYIAYADKEYQAFVREIILQADIWQKFKGSSRRIDFFAERLTNSNPRIREQAYIEVGRAPYSSIKRIAGSVPRHLIREFLANWRLVEWHSLYILMLGQSQHPDDRAYAKPVHLTRAGRPFRPWQKSPHMDFWQTCSSSAVKCLWCFTAEYRNIKFIFSICMWVWRATTLWSHGCGQLCFSWLWRLYCWSTQPHDELIIF